MLHLYGLNPKLMATVLGRGESVIYEYLDLIGIYLKDINTIRNYLRKRGVQMPANASEVYHEG